MPEPHILMTGIALGESPRWHDGRLWFSDWGAQEVITVDPAGKSEVVAHVPTFPFCIDFLPDGRLLIVSGREGLLLRQEPDGSLVTHADLTSLAEPPWNDIVVDGQGNIFVNNLGFAFGTGAAFAPGTIVVVPPDGKARQVAEGLAFPNGMTITPDNTTLIVGESYGERLTAFTIARDGGLSNRRVWAETPGDHPDGICLDMEGAVWYADVGSSRCVRVREGGEVLQTVHLDRGCFACMLGGVDRKTLHIVAAKWPDAMSGGERTGQLLAIDAPASGAGWP
ncbi:MAG TPA: SMP-30/gluconolactonase/LRE family protein [Ktedonobacterales bacterium]